MNKATTELDEKDLGHQIHLLVCIVKFRRIFILAGLLAIALITAACGRSSPPATTDPSPQTTAAPEITAPDQTPVEVPLSQDLRFGHLTTSDGLSEGRVWDITQDSRGFMWFTTWEGLNRYDGYEFKVYRQERENPNSPGGNGFFVVYEDRQGIIWAGSQTGGGLSRFDQTTEQWTRFQQDPDDPHSLSNNNVYAIMEDRSGRLWIGTEGGGLNRFEGETEDGQGRFTRYQHDPNDHHSLGSDFAVSIYEDNAGVLWIGTFGGGLNRFDRQTGTFTQYRYDPEDADSLSHNSVLPIYEDQSGELWVGTYGGGLNRFDQETETFTRYQHDPENPHSLSGDTVVDILEDQAGTLWIATFDGGLNRYLPEEDSFISYQHDPLNPHSLGSNTLASMFVDRSGILWIGTAGTGINRLDPRQQGFALVQHNPTDVNSLSNNDVRAIFEDRFGDLWIGTFGGLNRFDQETGRFTRHMHDPTDPSSLSDDHIFSFAEDSTGALWVGVDTYGLNRFNRGTETFSHYEPDPANPDSLSDGIIMRLYIDRKGTLWIGTFSEGLDAFDPESQDGQALFSHYSHDPEDPYSLSEGSINAIIEDRAGVLWVGTAGGGLNRFDSETETFSHFRYDPEDPSSLSDNTVIAIHEDLEGTLWIGTSGGLNRLDPQTGKFLHYTTADGLPHDTVACILNDEDGHLWLSTGRGLSHFDPTALRFRNYTDSDGLQGDSFNTRACYKTSKGELLFGGPRGLTGFYPDDIRENPHIPPVYVTSLQLANEPVGIGGDSPLETSILETEALVLSYDDRIISFEFSAMNFSAPDKNRYRYKLEGFEDNWREVDSSRRFATYTNLGPGDYVFRVIASNNDGVWNEEGASIAITVTPPWWETTWFRIGMGVLIIGLIIGSYRWRVRGVEAKSRELEVQVEERTQELQVAKMAADEARVSAETANLAKSSFLANMSHELRTPLNAILGFTRLLARDPGVSNQQEEMLEVINRSGEHLLSMVDDVLSLSSIEAGGVGLQQEPFDVVQLLQDVGLMIKSRAEGKGLQFDLELDAGLAPTLKGDAGKVRQVLINLLGNAVKFTETGGVWLRARSSPVTDDPALLMLQLEVEDSGPGIAQDKVDAIFEAFFQGEEYQNGEGGTGLGLTISKSLVTMMDGEITVESELGQGSLFKVNIPMQPAEAGAVAPDKVPVAVVTGLQAGQPEWRVLVVDDNPENRLLLTSLLEQVGFMVKEAQNGQEAIELFEEWRPHFIWMDMRMPVLDGYEATRRIRALPSGDEVRIAAVTASVFEEQREDILAAGCDEVVRKPFQEHKIFATMTQFLDIEYIYDQDGGTIPAQRHEPELTAAMLAELPPELLEELQETTLALDSEATLEVIARIEEIAPDTAAGLRALVQDLKMGRIRELLKEAEER